jgi:hypothetical protein
MQQMARSLFRSASRDAQRPADESTAQSPISAAEPYIRHRPTEPWELQRVEAALLIPPDEADTLKAVCAHITQHSGDPSSRALAGLVRALYQEDGSFNFESLDCLGPLMRRHAERLISARLWSALTDHEWQQAYAAVASYEFKENVAKLAASAKASPEPVVLSESKVTISGKASTEAKVADEPKPTSPLRPPESAKAVPGSRPAFEPNPAAESARIAPGPKPLAEVKPASEPRSAFEPSARRDESRIAAKVQTPAASPVTSLPYEPHAPQRLPWEMFPHADSFNLENIGRHWRVVLWFAMAAVGLAVVTYI